MRRWYRSLEVLALFHLLVACAFSQSPKREMRAVWLATVGGLDWPKSANPSSQQFSLEEMFDTLQLYRFNSVVFQVRARGNAFYNSAHEPWAGELTGDVSDSLGVAPAYDPLEYAIGRARLRGMEFHAWFNFAIAWSDTVAPISKDVSKPHVTAAHPEWTKKYGGTLWLDPGIPEARNYLRMVALDLVRNYDIDGVHFDYIRVANSDFPDDDSYASYLNDSTVAGKSAWRRENINMFMREFYDSVVAMKPWVKVGSAPIGIYQSITGATSSFNGLNLGQDSRQWMKEGKHDYVMPQIYWNFGEQSGPPYDPDFYALLLDWENNGFGKHVYPGLPAYRMAASSGGYPSNEFIKMVDSTRAVGSRVGSGPGNIYFRYGSLAINNYWSYVVSQRYNDPALVPPMPWKDNLNPSPPDSFKIVKNASTATMSWRTPPGEPVRYYVVYQSLTLPIPYDNPFYIYYFGRDTSVVLNTLPSPPFTAYYAVTALDRGNNESQPTQVWGVNTGGVVGVGKELEGVPRFSLSQNYPNPFNPTTIISYAVPGRTKVLMRVYDVLGREIQILQDGIVGPGEQQVMFDGSGLPSGIYLYRLEAEGFVEARKMILVR